MASYSHQVFLKLIEYFEMVFLKIPYKGKLWRVETLANLANDHKFAKVFLYTVLPSANMSGFSRASDLTCNNKSSGYVHVLLPNHKIASMYILISIPSRYFSKLVVVIYKQKVYLYVIYVC